MSSVWTVRRSATDRKVSGVASGLARAWDVDPMLVRVGFAVLALSGGIGIVLYAAGWLMLPLEGKEQSQLEEWIPQTGNWSREVKVGVVVAACIIGAIALSWLVPFSFTAALVVAAIWYFGYYRNRDRHRRDERNEQANRLQFAEFPGEPTAFTEAAQAWQQRITEYQQAQATRAAFTPPATASQPEPVDYGSGYNASSYPAPYGSSSGSYGSVSSATSPQPAFGDFDHAAFLSRPDPVGLYSEPAADSAIERLAGERRARRLAARRLGTVSLTILGLTMAALAVASVSGVTVPVAGYLATALLIFGLTLLIGARVGRPRGLAFGTVVVAIAMVLTLLAQHNTAFAGDVGFRHPRYTSVAQLPNSDHLRTGQLTVDLRDVGTPDQSRTYTASVGTGRLVVDLPRNANTSLTGTVREGLIKEDGQSLKSGPRLTLLEPAAGGATTPVLTIKLQVGNGELEVRR